MKLKYTIKEGAPSPMVFISMHLGYPDEPLDLSPYTSVSLQIREATNKKIMIFIKTFVPRVSLKGIENSITLRHNQNIIQLVPGINHYKIRLKEFKTPRWWLEYMNVNGLQLPEELFDNVVGFDMQFNPAGSDFQFGKHESIIIENIAFHRSLSLPAFVLIVIILCYYTGISTFLILKRMRVGTQKLPLHKPLELSSYRGDELHRIKSFIESHYNDPDISTRMIYKALGIPVSRVFNLCKEEYRLTFKQLINKMRIEEAKRLLRETDLRIIDIALNLGFNDISYFNKLFKTCERVTPAEYREKGKHSQ
jgi:AraC-like DNA-binding protein